MPAWACYPGTPNIRCRRFASFNAEIWASLLPGAHARFRFCLRQSTSIQCSGFSFAFGDQRYAPPRFRFCHWRPKIFNAPVSALLLATKNMQRNGFGFVFGDQRYSAPLATGFGFAFGDQKDSAQRFRFCQWRPKIFNAPASALLLATKDILRNGFSCVFDYQYIQRKGFAFSFGPAGTWVGVAKFWLRLCRLWLALDGSRRWQWQHVGNPGGTWVGVARFRLRLCCDWLA